MSEYQIKGIRENGTGGYDEYYIPEPNPFHGMQTYGALSWDNSTHILTIASGTNTYWFQGTRFSTTSAITCDLDSFVTIADNTLYFFYFDDATGVLKASADVWNLKTKVPVATVYWATAAGAVQRETHNHTRNLDWHERSHKFIGTVYYSGLDITAPTTASDAVLNLTTGTVADEDIEFTTGQQQVMRGWYKASVSKFTWADYSLPYLGTSGTPQFLDTDTYTLANVGASGYVCYWVYCALDIDRPIYIFPSHLSQPHNTLAIARTEAVPVLSGLGLNSDMKLLYRWIYKGDGEFQEVTDYRLSAPVPSGGVPTSTAGSITFSPFGNIAASNVQAAIEELDTEKLAVASKASAAELVAGTEDTKYPTSKGLKDAEFIPIHIGTTAPADTSILWLDTDEEVVGGTDEKVKYNVSDTAAGYLADKIVAGTGISLAEGTGGDADKLVITNTGVSSMAIWTALTGTYASATTFTFTGTDTDVALIQLSLLTCTDSAGTTRRIGYVKSAVNNTGTITATVVTDTDLASGDKDFKVAYNRKVTDYLHLISIPGQVIADTGYSQGVWKQDLMVNSYLLPVDASVLTAAAGSGAACVFQVYKNSTTLFSSAPDLGTNAVLRAQRPTTKDLSAAETISLRITNSAGATNFASDFQAKLYIIPTLIFTAF